MGTWARVRHNALDFTLLDGLDEAFTRAEADDDVWVVVLSGAGKSFSSGYDRTGSYYITPPEDGWTSREALLRLRGIEARYLRIWNFPSRPSRASTATVSPAGATCRSCATSRWPPRTP